MKDILFIIPNNAAVTNQSLENRYAALEPPTWALILAESVRSKSFTQAITNRLAEQISDADVAKRFQSFPLS